MPSDTVTVEPSSPVPMNVGVVSGVPLRSAGDTITGAAGAWVSIVRLTVGPVARLPAASTAAAPIECDPSESGAAGEHDHVPPATTAVHNADAPSDTVTVELLSPEPVNCGVLSFVRPTGPVITGAAGAVVSAAWSSSWSWTWSSSSGPRVGVLGLGVLGLGVLRDRRQAVPRWDRDRRPARRRDIRAPAWAGSCRRRSTRIVVVEVVEVVEVVVESSKSSMLKSSSNSESNDVVSVTSSSTPTSTGSLTSSPLTRSLDSSSSSGSVRSVASVVVVERAGSVVDTSPPRRLDWSSPPALPAMTTTSTSASPAARVM